MEKLLGTVGERENVLARERQRRKVLKQWFYARDVMFGLNCKTVNFVLGLDLARKCAHEDAVWLSSLLPPLKLGKRNLLVFASETLRKHWEQFCDPRAACFYGLLNYWTGHDLLEKAAEMGYPFAQACMADSILEHGLGNFVEVEKWTTLAFEGREPRALAILATRSGGQWHETSMNLLREAAEMGDVRSQYAYGLAQSVKGPLYYRWIAKALQGGFRVSLDTFKSNIVTCVTSYIPGETCAEAVYEIGRSITRRKPCLDFLLVTENVDYRSWSAEAVKIYRKCNSLTRLAVLTWCLVAKKVGRALINKDVSLKIAKFVWSSRSLGLY